jgi:hypothetical protein
MRANYANSNTWHSANTDLHHALLGGIGGGIAYIGVLCSSNWGFGLTGGLSGSFVSMGEPTVWDMKGFMHEVCSLGYILICLASTCSLICIATLNFLPGWT